MGRPPHGITSVTEGVVAWLAREQVWETRWERMSSSRYAEL